MTSKISSCQDVGIGNSLRQEPITVFIHEMISPPPTPSKHHVARLKSHKEFPFLPIFVFTFSHLSAEALRKNTQELHE